MNYDDIIPYLGDFGGYQKKIYVLLCLPAILCAFHKLAGVFLLAVPDHRCQLDSEFSNATFQLTADILKISLPFDNKREKFSQCEYFSNSSMKSCDNFVYDTSQYESSAVTSFDLVCDRSHLRASADALMMFGVFIGSYVFGHLSDKYGRRPVFMTSLMIQVIFGMLTAISPEFITYTICRMIVGATTSGVFLVAYCLSLEMVGKESRIYAGTVIMMFFSFGYMLIGGFAYFISEWRLLQIALTLPGILFLVYWWFIPESTRWLLANNKKGEAIKQIQKIAKANQLSIPQEILEKLQEEVEYNFDNNEPKPSLLDLFKTPNLRTKSILIFFNWFIISGTYYGLSWDTNSLGGNLLINFIISGAVEFPAYSLLLVTLNRYGRKIILAGSMIFAGVMLLLSLTIPKQYNWLRIVLTMLGKLSITSSFGTIYVFSVEQFPTVIRNVALGAASMAARVGGISAPYVIYLAQFWNPFPAFIFGISALIGGALSMLLPETYNTQMPETIADGEQLGKAYDEKMEIEMETLKPNGQKKSKLNIW